MTKVSMSSEKQLHNTEKKTIKEIKKILKKEFNLEKEWIDFIIKPLQGYVWEEDYLYLKNVKDISPDARIKNPPSFYLLNEEEGVVEKVSFTSHPLVLFSFYLKEKYGDKIFPLYFLSLTHLNKPKEYLKELKEFIKVPFIRELKNLKTKPVKEVLNKKYGK